MSNLIFPAFSPPGFTPTWPVKKTPRFATIVQTPASQRGEVRVSLTPYPIWMFEYELSILKGDMGIAGGLQNMIGFFGSVLGSAQDWLFEDPNDNAVADMQFGTGDGTTTSFQLLRNIAGMLDIVQNVNGVPTIMIGGVVQSPTNYSISATGIVTFGTAPANLAVLTWTGSFFFRCRFEEDTLSDLSEFMYELWSIDSLKFRSLIL